MFGASPVAVVRYSGHWAEPKCTNQAIADAPNIFTEKSRISTPLNGRDFFVRCRGGACSDWCYMLVLCAVCRVVARRDSTLYQVAVIVPVWNGFSHGYEYENEWLCMLYGRMIIRPYTLWHLYEFYVILLNNTTKILWNMPQEIIFATFAVASAAIIQRLRQTLHNEKAS